jgi:hypothetical protein
MADDDLPTRLHWPADPLDVAGDRADSGGAPGDPAATRAGRTGEPRWVLGEQNDVALLRQEVADLRHAVDDLADRVQLRQLRASLDELRGEVISLRRVVVEWPELDQLTTEVAALRSQLIDQQEETPTVSMADVLSEVRTALVAASSARTPVGALAPIVEELGALRGEVAALRRRISLRGEGTGSVDDGQLERVVESVVERVTARTQPAGSRRRR